jgi:nucleotide-binding universal stress UspA family protein
MSPEAPRTVLATTDFSAAAETALAWAAEIARGHRARLVVVHALTPPIPPSATPDFVSFPPEFHEQYRHAAVTRLEETGARLRQGGLTVETDLEIGPAAQTVLDLAKKHRADVLVVATRGLTGLRGLLLGGTARRIVQTSPVPVLVIHPEEKSSARPLRTVLVPTDFSHDAGLAIETARRLLHAAEPGARIVLLHAYHLPVEFTALGAVPVTPYLFADAAEQARGQLEKVAAPLRGHGVEVECVAREGYPPSVIEEEARARKVDLIAMGTHGRTGLRHLLLGSTAERVVEHAPCPVLVVRRPD